MTFEQAIEQLKDLRRDRESFLKSSHDEVWQDDIDALDVAIRTLDTALKSQYISLPCAVGDKVWHISDGDIHYGVAEWFDMDKDKQWCVTVINPPKEFNFIRFEDFGSTAFLTREEAEAKIKGESRNEH